MTRLVQLIIAGFFLSHMFCTEASLLIDLPLDQEARITQYFAARYPDDQSVSVNVIEDRCQFDLTQYFSITPVGDDYARTYYELVAERWSAVATERSRDALAWCISSASLVMHEKIESGSLACGFEYPHYNNLRYALSRRFVAMTLAEKSGVAFDALFIDMLRESYRPDIDVSVLDEYAELLGVDARPRFYEVILGEITKEGGMSPYDTILRREKFRPTDGEMTQLIQKLPGLAEYYLLHFDSANVRGQNIALRKFRESDQGESWHGFRIILDYLSKDITEDRKKELLEAVFLKMQYIIEADQQGRLADSWNDVKESPAAQLLNYSMFLLGNARGFGATRLPVICIVDRVEEIAAYLTWINDSANKIPEQNRAAMLKLVEAELLQVESIKRAH